MNSKLNTGISFWNFMRMGALISSVCVHYACTVSQEGNRASDHLQLELYTVRVAMSVGAGS